MQTGDILGHKGQDTLNSTIQNGYPFFFVFGLVKCCLFSGGDRSVDKLWKNVQPNYRKCANHTQMRINMRKLDIWKIEN